MSKIRNLLWLLPIALMVFVMGGCGKSGPKRYEVSGEVTLKGQPLDDGFIEFHPMDGQGSMDAATIKDGHYQIPKNKGLQAGKYKLIIIAGDGLSGAGDASPTITKRKPTPGLVLGKERIPPQYNRNSNVIREVKDGDPNKFDFHFD
jgi:hypothetical protein